MDIYIDTEWHRQIHQISSLAQTLDRKFRSINRAATHRTMWPCIFIFTLFLLPVRAANNPANPFNGNSDTTVSTSTGTLMDLPGELLAIIAATLDNRSFMHWMFTTKALHGWAQDALPRGQPLFSAQVCMFVRKDEEALRKLLLDLYLEGQDMLLKHGVYEDIVALTKQAIDNETNPKALFRLLSRLFRGDFASPRLCMLFEVLDVPRVCQLLSIELSNDGLPSPELQKYVRFNISRRKREPLIGLVAYLRQKNPANWHSIRKSFWQFFVDKIVMSDDLETTKFGADMIPVLLPLLEADTAKFRAFLDKGIATTKIYLDGLKTQIIQCIKTSDPGCDTLLDQFCRDATRYIGSQLLLFGTERDTRCPCPSNSIMHGAIGRLFGGAFELGRLDVIRKMMGGHSLISWVIGLYLEADVLESWISPLSPNFILPRGAAIGASNSVGSEKGCSATHDFDELVDSEYSGGINPTLRSKLANALGEADRPLLCYRYFRLIFMCVMLNQPRRLAFLLSNWTANTLPWLSTKYYFDYFLELEALSYRSENVKRVLLAYAPK